MDPNVNNSSTTVQPGADRAQQDSADFANIINSDPAVESEIQELKQDTQEFAAVAVNSAASPEVVDKKEEDMEIAAEGVAEKMMANPETKVKVMNKINDITPKSDEEAEKILTKFDPNFVARLPFGKQYFLRKLTPILDALEAEKENGNLSETKQRVLAKLQETRAVVQRAIDNSFSSRLKRSFGNFTSSVRNMKMPWRRGGKTKKHRRIKKMKFGGDEVSDFFGFIFWIVGSFFGGGISVIGYLGSGFFEQIMNFISLLCYLYSSLPSAPSGVGMGVGALAAYVQARTNNAWIPGQGPSNDKYRRAAAVNIAANNFGGKRRSKCNKRKSVKKTRTYKK